jgi:phosphoribosyl-AMP cyclohydrolase
MKNITFTNKKLIPAVIQDYKSLQVYMLGYMNKKSLTLTRQTGFVWFWSRSRKKLWMKGETSGNRLKVKKIFIDCDGDTLLIKAELIGSAVCHTGNLSCFFTELEEIL